MVGDINPTYSTIQKSEYVRISSPYCSYLLQSTCIISIKQFTLIEWTNLEWILKVRFWVNQTSRRFWSNFIGNIDLLSNSMSSETGLFRFEVADEKRFSPDLIPSRLMEQQLTSSPLGGIEKLTKKETFSLSVIDDFRTTGAENGFFSNLELALVARKLEKI